MSESTPKKVDESWKDSVRKEKEKVVPASPAADAPESDFLSFASTLAMQALAFMGELPENPGAPAVKTDLRQSKYLIDTLQMLSEKTKGNLTESETNELNTLLYEVRMRFVRKSEKEPAL